MKKFEGMLFCTDLDGTLYTDDKTISKENLDAIEYFKSEGGLFTFITGRVPLTSTEICNVTRPNAPYGCVNGAGIYDQNQDRFLWKLTIPQEVAALVQAVEVRMPEIGIQFNTEEGIYFYKDNDSMVNFRRATGMPHLTCGLEKLQEPQLKIILGHTDGQVVDRAAELVAAHPLAEQFDFVRSELALFDILPKGAGKGTALRKMAELLAIDPAKTIAIGDYNNDISMLKAAGLSFAVANAVPEAKAASKYHTVSNNENAIAAVIDGLDWGKFTS